jgi:glyoxylase-like metal-dependent hydrolase (beta-lactamase superfamily II)
MSAGVEIAPGIVRIPLVPRDLVNAFALRDQDGQVTLVDTGLKGSPQRILAALAEMGAAPEDVTRIVITHAHSDHAGGVAALAGRTAADVAVHGDDADDVRAGRSAPLDPSGWMGRIMRRAGGTVPAPVTSVLHDGQVLDVAGGLRVLHTPGHTPGHVSLVHLASRTLITGDAIWNMNSRRTWPVLAFCTDRALTTQTAQRLADEEYETAAFMHGPEIRDRGREAVRGFLRRPRGFRMFL